jgi:hypothetical protein
MAKGAFMFAVHQVNVKLRVNWHQNLRFLLFFYYNFYSYCFIPCCSSSSSSSFSFSGTIITPVSFLLFTPFVPVYKLLYP